MAKFKSLTEYYEWCDAVISKIYYANMAMNNEAIKDAVAEIASTLHVSEGGHLIDNSADVNPAPS